MNDSAHCVFGSLYSHHPFIKNYCRGFFHTEKIQISTNLMASLGKLVGHPAPDVGGHLRQFVQLGGEAGHAERPVARELLQPATTSTTRGLARGACLAVQGLCGS